MASEKDASTSEALQPSTYGGARDRMGGPKEGGEGAVAAGEAAARASVIASLRARRSLSVKWEQAPDPLVPAWVADMDLVPPEVVRREVADAVLRGDVGYTSGSLEERYREALASWSKARTGHVPVHTTLVADVLGGLALALWTLTPADGVVLVPTPAYPPFLALPPALGRRVATMPLREEDGFRPDPERVEHAIASSDACALILCNPHNPTGVVATASELLALAEVAWRRGVLVIADEIHQDLLREGRRHVPFLSLDHPIVERAVGLSAATKTFNIAGMKAAHVESASREVQEALGSVEGHLRGAATPLGMLASAIAWEEGGPWLESTVARIDENLRQAVDSLSASRFLRTTLPEGTYLLWVHATRLGGLSAAAWARERGVVVSPGESFDVEGGKEWFRLNVATEPEVLAEILGRLTEASA